MGAGWRRRATGGGRPLAVLAVVVVFGVVGALGSAAGAGVAAKAVIVPTAGQLSQARKLAATLAVALSGLRTQGEVLTERYDHEVALEQQDAAAYKVARARLAAARKREQRALALLGQQAAADYEANGGPGLADAVYAGLTDPQGYLATLGLQQALDNQRVDLLAASKGDAIVTRLFSAQAATLLRQQRSAAQSAGFLRSAVIAAVNRQVSVLAAADKDRSRLAAEAAAARASEAYHPVGEGGVGEGGVGAGGVGGVPAGLPASVLAGGPAGAAPGVTAPDWAPAAGASAAQGNTAADWALTQLGKPYRWGAAGPGAYDCSGLALQAWARAGIRLLHWTGFQWVSGPHVPLARLRRGDLVFFATNVADPATIHHVGIYIGDGLMVDAPYTGAFVEIDSIYKVGGLIGATRPAA